MPDKEGWDQDRTRVWELWDKNFMELIDSPNISPQLLIHVKFIAYGEINDPLKPFQCRYSNMKLPGEESYTPNLPG